MYPHISVNIIADSVAPSGVRLTTFELCYPRFIHAEFMTHRMFSRNAQSTRAIPTAKRIARVVQNPVTPIRWGANQKGMQAKDCDVDNVQACKDEWDHISKECAEASRILTELGLHKQWAGRLLEPFDTITVICTATDYENFFSLRCAPDAQPEINDLAWKMADAYYGNEPRQLPYGCWHLPYIEGARHSLINDYASKNGRAWGSSILDLQLKVSAACCARVSYLNHDGSVASVEKDLELYKTLVNSGHMTPLEHQATPIDPAEIRQEYSGNFRGWLQHRKQLLNECRPFNYIGARARLAQEKAK